MADSETRQPVDTTQQVTSKTPTTRQQNPKRVAAGKAVTEKTKQVHEAQKKALAEAQVIIANNQLKQAAPPVADTPAADPPSSGPPVESESTKNVLTTTQWLSVISIFISLAGIYYKREEIKNLFKTRLRLPRLRQTLCLPHLLMPRRKEKEVSVLWIELSLCFYV